MNKLAYGLAFVFTFALASMAQAATIVNVDGLNNASLTGGTGGTGGIDIFLTTGSYQMTFVDESVDGASYTAFSRFSGSSECTNGANCRTGWENSVRYIIDATTYKFGDGNASGGLPPQPPGDLYYESAAISFANSGGYVENFTLTADKTVRFFLYDDNLPDNRGGVSLSIAAVPLPAAAWLFGSAILGLVAVKRRKARRRKYRGPGS